MLSGKAGMTDHIRKYHPCRERFEAKLLIVGAVLPKLSGVFHEVVKPTHDTIVGRAIQDLHKRQAQGGKSSKRGGAQMIQRSFL